MMKVSSEPLIKGAWMLLNIVGILALTTQLIGIVLLFRFSPYAPDVLCAGGVVYLAVFCIFVVRAIRKRRRAATTGDIRV